MIEDESRPLPDDPKFDVIVRFIVGGILIFGGGYFALEFLHWISHGGFSDFLTRSAIAVLIFFGLVLFSCALAKGSSFLRSRPAGFLLVGILVAGGLLGHFLTST